MTDKVCGKHPKAGSKMVLTPEITHYGKWVCCECDKFLTWARQPKTNDEMVARQTRIQEILRFAADVMTDKDLHDACQIYGKPHLGLVLQNRYDELQTVYSPHDNDI